MLAWVALPIIEPDADKHNLQQCCAALVNFVSVDAYFHFASKGSDEACREKPVRSQYLQAGKFSTFPFRMAGVYRQLR